MARYEGIWRKRHLLPAWILQIICSIIFIIVAAVLMAAAAQLKRQSRTHSSSIELDSYYGYSRSELITYVKASAGVALGLGLSTLILDIVEIVLYAQRKLSPVIVLSYACAKTLVWLAYFIIAVLGSAFGSVSILDIILGVVLAATSIGQLVLGAVYTHRQRRGTLFPRNEGKVGDIEQVPSATYDNTVR